MESGTIQTSTTPFILLKSNARDTQWPRRLCKNYMDDFIISSFTETEHLEHIRQVFQRFRDHKMKLKLAKCEFLRDKIQFLGHVIDHEGICTIPEKMKEISKIKSPANVDEAKAFLGVLNYYRHAPHPETAEKKCKIQLDNRLRKCI